MDSITVDEVTSIKPVTDEKKEKHLYQKTKKKEKKNIKKKQKEEGEKHIIDIYV